MTKLVLPVCELAHREVAKILYPGAVAVDATMGKGEDTFFLCDAVGEAGTVYAFDIQESALEQTRKRLESAGLLSRAELILAGHETMSRRIAAGSVCCVFFNLGYLPGGDHDIVTTKETTLAALTSSLTLLEPGGAVFIAVYWGHPGGEEEKKAVEAFVRNLPVSAWDISETTFPNRNKAPIMLIIQKK